MFVKIWAGQKITENIAVVFNIKKVCIYCSISHYMQIINSYKIKTLFTKKIKHV